MADLDFRIFDADNHYYEAVDAFTRYGDPAMAKRTMQWTELNGRQRLLVAGTINRFIPNPQFDPVAKPGSLDEYFRGRTSADDIRSAFGELLPIDPGYRDPEARLKIMDRQNMDGCFMFPTLGVGMEEALIGDPEAAHAAFHAFNRWLLDDWGFNYQGRIFGAPYLTMLDPDLALKEIEWVIEQGARVIVMRSGPIMAPTGGRSPGDRVYDPFWSAIDEAGITVAFHSGDAGYARYAADWGETLTMEAFRSSAFKSVTSADRPIYDSLAALVCHGVFTRFPKVRVATIESGSDWAPQLIKKLKKAWSQSPGSFDGVDPVAQFLNNVWVAPYYEDDIPALVDTMGVDHVLFGSDWPHAEGLAEPTDFIHDISTLGDDAAKRIMRDNALALSVPV